MSELEVEAFVTKLAATWAAGDSEAFRDLWHADGVLHHVLLDREAAGAELPDLHRLQLAAAPDLRWTMIDWTWRRSGRRGISQQLDDCNGQAIRVARCRRSSTRGRQDHG